MAGPKPGHWLFSKASARQLPPDIQICASTPASNRLNRRGALDSKHKSQDSVMSDNEFHPKPLTRAERIKMNLSVAIVTLGILVMGGVMLHYHVDPPSQYQTAAPSQPAKKI
jgi:hypothetical protein